MRLLHTSDWHLGRSLHGVDLLDHQAAYLDHLVDVVRAEQVDAVVVAGDVYDRAIPPVEAVTLLSDTLARLAEHTTVVVTSGNHDSATRLGFGSALMRDRVRLRTRVAGLAEPVVLPDDEGDVLVYGIPYLDPDFARVELADGPELLARSHQAVAAAAMRRIRDDLAARQGSARPRSVVAAHAFVIGGAPTDSERDIRVGGVDQVPAGRVRGRRTTWRSATCTARRRCRGVDGTVLRYSGSPLAYSFSEQHHAKSTVLVDLSGGQVRTSLVAAPVPRRLADVTGTLEELLGAAGAPHADAWTRVTVTDAHRPEDLYRRVKQRFPHALVVHHRAAQSAESSRAAGRHGGARPAGRRSRLPRARHRARPDARRGGRAAARVRGRRRDGAERLMHLRTLTLQAIGPFAGRHTVDFDALGQAGLFLLEGPTGSGKSTLIDAIVFALYGKVASSEASEDRLRSAYAADDVESVVDLVFEVPSGIYRVRRTPVYQRAKRRGSGTTTANASVKAWRLPAGTDLDPATLDSVGVPLGNRLDEVGAEIQKAVGLDRTQFVQTIVLPQGEFAHFLRAKPEERRGLLQKIFGTEVYEQLAAAPGGDASRERPGERGGAGGAVDGRVAAGRRCTARPTTRPRTCGRRSTRPWCVATGWWPRCGRWWSARTDELDGWAAGARAAAVAADAVPAGQRAPTSTRRPPRTPCCGAATDCGRNGQRWRRGGHERRGDPAAHGRSGGPGRPTAAARRRPRRHDARRGPQDRDRRAGRSPGRHRDPAGRHRPADARAGGRALGGGGGGCARTAGRGRGRARVSSPSRAPDTSRGRRPRRRDRDGRRSGSPRGRPRGPPC